MGLIMNSLDNNADAYKKDFKYDFDNDIMLKYYPKRIIRKLKKGSFLELGLGHGYTINEFFKYVDKYTILEGSKAVISNFTNNEPKLCKYVNIIETYFEEFQTDIKYDNIVMGFILEHVDDPHLIIRKYKNLLSKDGKMFIAVPNAESLHRQIGFHAGYMDHLKTLSEADILLGHKRYYDKKELIQLAHVHQMKVLSIEGILLKPLMTSQLQSLALPKEILNGMLEMGLKYPELSNAILMELSVE